MDFTVRGESGWGRASLTQRPPGLALLISNYMRGSFELAVVSGIGGAPDQRPTNDAWPLHIIMILNQFIQVQAQV